MIKRDHLSLREVRNVIQELQNDKKMCVFHEMKNPCEKTLEMKHKWLYKKHKRINNFNKKFLGDNFWKVLTYTLVKQRICTINQQIVKYLQNTILSNKINFV